MSLHEDTKRWKGVRLMRDPAPPVTFAHLWYATKQIQAMRPDIRNRWRSSRADSIMRRHIKYSILCSFFSEFDQTQINPS